jgi:hypothetical protein
LEFIVRVSTSRRHGWFMYRRLGVSSADMARHISDTHLLQDSVLGLRAYEEFSVNEGT